MMARNFDYPYGTALIMHTIPDEGYESITTFSTDFFGFGENYKPEGFKNQYMAKAAVQWKFTLTMVKICRGNT